MGQYEFPNPEWSEVSEEGKIETHLEETISDKILMKKHELLFCSYQQTEVKTQCLFTRSSGSQNDVTEKSPALLTGLFWLLFNRNFCVQVILLYEEL